MRAVPAMASEKRLKGEEAGCRAGVAAAESRAGRESLRRSQGPRNGLPMARGHGWVKGLTGPSTAGMGRHTTC